MKFEQKFKRFKTCLNSLLLLHIATWFSKWGKHVAKKTVVPYKGCGSSGHRITLYSCTLDLMYASVHHFLKKEEKSSLIAKYFLFYDFSWKYLCKTWWYHENFRNQRKCFQNIHLSIMTKTTLSKDIHMSTIGVKTQFVFQLVSSHNWFSKGSLIEGEQDFTKNSWIIKCFTLKMIQVWLCVSKWIFHEFLV